MYRGVVCVCWNASCDVEEKCVTSIDSECNARWRVPTGLNSRQYSLPYLVLPAKNGLEYNFNQKGMGIKGEVVQYSM